MFFFLKKILPLLCLSILTQDHEFSEDEEPEDMAEELDEDLESKKNVPADVASDNSLKKVLTPLERYDDMCLNPEILPKSKHMDSMVSAGGRIQLSLGAEILL